MTRNVLVSLFVVVVLVLGAFGSVSAEPLQWSGNGHFYEVSNVSLHWSDAKVFAENQTLNGMKGHLVTITSAEEDAFIMQLDLPDTYYHTGALQMEGTQDPLANWTWITGEPWVYENWVGLEPNDMFGEEDNMVVMKAAGGWGDINGDDHSYSWAQNRFIVEYESLCRGDFDLDGDVDSSDLVVFAADFGRTDCPCWNCQDDDEANGIYRICNYLPLNPGNQWVYTTGNRIVLNETYISSNGCSGIRFGSTTYEFDMFMQNGDKGLLVNAEIDRDDDRFFQFNPPLVLINAEMEIGNTIYQSFIWPDLSSTLFATTLEGIEPLTVPSGQYVTLRFLIEIEDVGKCTYKTYVWFAKDIGIVKIVRTGANPIDCGGCIFVCGPDMNTPAELVSSIVNSNN